MQRFLHGLRVRLRAPSRNARTAVVVGRLLGAAFLLCFATGLYSHALQDPAPWMTFPTRPVWLYQVTQGIHITAGILCVPLILAKLYAVYPELFQTPPVRSFPHFLERASIALFVATSLVQLAIGLLNTYQWYQLFPFPFRQTHYALSFVIIGSLAIHIGIKLPVIAQYWRRRNAYAPDGSVVPRADATRETEPEAPSGVTGRVMAWIDRVPDERPARPSRRAFLLGITASGAALVALTAGQSFRALDGINVFAPRKAGVGPQRLPVNRTAHQAGVEQTARADDWRLAVVAATTASLSLADLRALPQYDVELPIACVEGWSQMARWRGPRLKDVMATAGGSSAASVDVTSLEDGTYGRSTVGPEWVADDLTLVALELDGEVLDLDHGYPARLIAPGRPGVLQTKWLARLESAS